MSAKPWSPLVRCSTWFDAHQTAASMQRGDVLLRTITPPPIGADVHLTLRLPDESEIVLQGDVTDIMAAQGAVVRFRVATPILTQLEARASSERPPARPLARGTAQCAVQPSPEDEEAGVTYSIHRRKKSRS
jgi:hypothetical protein